MSSENKYLALRLQGPLQSWGFDSQYNRRNTGLMPTKSALGGMCCAALGFGRGSAEERTFLADFAEVRMTTIAIPRVVERKFAGPARKMKLGVRRLQDYHTVQNTRKADGGMKDCHITHRQYLTDASFRRSYRRQRGLAQTNRRRSFRSEMGRLAWTQDVHSVGAGIGRIAQTRAPRR